MSKKSKVKDTVIMNPIVGGLPDDIRPAYSLNVTQEEHFYEIARAMHSNKMLSSVDRFQITNAAVIMDKLIAAKIELDSSGLTQTFESGAEQVSAPLSAYTKLHSDWLKCVNHLGLTPAARQKILGKPNGEVKQGSESKPSMVIGRK